MTTTRTGRIDSTKSSTCLQLQYNNVGFSGKEAIPFTVKGPIPVHLPESNGDYAGRTGCSILELSFQYPCQIGELVFCNYYTAWMSVFVKRMTNKIKNPPQKEKEISPCTNYRARPLLERSFSIDIPGKEKCRSRSPLPKLSSPPSSCKESKILRRPSTASMTPDDEFEPLELKRETLPTGCLQQMSFSKRRHSSGSLSTETPAVSETKPWELSIEMKNLMPWPHFECGSQDLVSIPATEFIAISPEEKFHAFPLQENSPCLVCSRNLAGEYPDHSRSVHKVQVGLGPDHNRHGGRHGVVDSQK